MNYAEAATAAGIAGAHVGALIVLAWALAGDPARGRKRCPRCAYDMSGATPDDAQPTPSIPTCPECGHRCKRDRDLLRTRRRWRTAAVALLVEVGGLYFWYQRMPGREGWRGLIPSAALIELVENPDARSELADALRARQADRQLSSGQNRRLVERQIDRWIAAGGPARLVQYRTEWPIGEPMVVSMWAPTGVPDVAAGVWYSIGPEDLVTSPGGLYEPEPRTHVNWGESGPPSRDATLTPVAEGTNHFPVVLNIRASSDFSTKPRWTIERSVPIPIVVVGRGTIDDIIPPTQDPAVERALTSGLSFYIGMNEREDTDRLWLMASMDSTAFANLAFTGAIFYDLILERAGAPVVTIPMRWFYPEARWRSWGIPILPLDDPAAAGLHTDRPLRFVAPDAVIRFRSRSSPTALAQPAVSKRWQGDFAVPLADFPIIQRWDPENRMWVQGDVLSRPARPAETP